MKKLILSKFFNPISIILILIATLIIYSKTIDYPFQFDDYPLLLSNDAIKSDKPVQSILEEFPLRLVSFLSFSANLSNNPNPADFRIVNILIHLINTSLVFLLILTFFKTPFIKDKYELQNQRLFAVFIALIFAVHPIQTQGVIYIYQRLASLVAMFYFGAVLSYIQFRLSEKQSHKTLFLILTIISTLGGMLSKENSFTIPLMLVVVEALLLHKKIKINWKFIPFVLAFIILGVYLFFKFDMLNKLQYTRYYYTGEMITNLNYLYTQFSVLIKYLFMLIVPIGQNVDHQYTLSHNIFDLKALLSLIIHIGILIFSIIYFKKNRLFTIGIFWFYITISIESSVIPIRDVIFEHRLYLPMIGFFIALISLLLHISRKNFNIVLVIILLLFSSFLIYKTNKRAEVWKSHVALWTDAIKKSPNKIRPFNNRGDSYFRTGKFQNAINDFSMAINNLQPAINNLKLSEAPRWYLDNIAGPYKNRGLSYYNSGNLQKSLEDFNKYIEINYKDKTVYNDRANVFKALKKYKEAIKDYSVFIKNAGLDFPLIDIVIKNRGICYMNLEQYEKAIKDYNTAIEKKPNMPNYYILRAFCYYKQNKLNLAEQDYLRALQLNPDSEEAKRNLNIIRQLKQK